MVRRRFSHLRGALASLPLIILLPLNAFLLLSPGCSVIKGTYHVVKGTYRVVKRTVTGTVWVIKGAYELTAGTTRLVYRIGKFTFTVVRAPLEWPLTHEEIETIDGLPVKEAIRLGRVKNAPYVVNGRRYVPMTVAQAQTYEEVGIASWYGEETRRKAGGHMTANGEVFDPRAYTAAHKYLPLPTMVKVTNLENGRSLIVRVNDRGPFPSKHNPHSGKRIIDLSWGAAKRLGFVEKGLARVHVKVIPVKLVSG
ncbi:MAG: septal ring lytic transglycosylase RlpA family protein [Nitrospirae bacterium]|nr:MAG: septal ring lytic transglycosylase RlpA family protein [Nitrospirota bacterium]